MTQHKLVYVTYNFYSLRFKRDKLPSLTRFGLDFRGGFEFKLELWGRLFIYILEGGGGGGV